jgi:DnaJ-domain-containing protein 1
MTGQLQEHPLAELLHEISAAGLSGALRLEHERLKTVVYLAGGEIIYAASNLRLHRLAECVRRWQLLSEQELSAMPRSASDIDLAEALVERNVLSRESLEELQTRQVLEVLRPVMLWTEGIWEFDARVRMNREVRVGVDRKSLLLESARRLPAEFVAGRFPNENEKLRPEKQAPVNLELRPTEAFVFSRIDAPLALSELIAISTLPETEVKQIVYTLALGGLIERERWPLAFSPEALEKARALKVAQKPSAPPAAAPSRPEVVEAKSAAATMDAPAQAETGEAVALEQLFARLAVAEDYYQVLGVRRSATVGEIKSSYHKLAKNFHPDRFHQDEDASLRARIEESFARIAQAYETLKDKQGRAAYDLKLSQQNSPANTLGAASQQNAQRSGAAAANTGAASDAAHAAALLRQAEDSFGRGMLAFKQGKFPVAVASFGEAARLVPREARYRAFHGCVLARYEGTRRQAEAELKAAIALDSNNASYHIMLAEFYSQIGLTRRSLGELERALAIDSQNTTARQLFDKLQATLKGQL